MNRNIGELEIIEMRVNNLPQVESKELTSLSDIYNQLIADKFDVSEELEKLRFQYAILISKKEEELNRLTYEAKRIDTLRNEIVNQIFNKKPKRTYERNLEVGFKKTRIYARKK
jgi:formyltetrahydrofolate hydrolase